MKRARIWNLENPQKNKLYNSKLNKNVSNMLNVFASKKSLNILGNYFKYEPVHLLLLLNLLSICI